MKDSSRERISNGEPPQASSGAPSPSTDDAPRHDPDLIALAAYRRYEARGREDGRDMEDWLFAEREIRGGPASETDTRTDGVATDD
jgi:hypothetical protein